MRRRTLEDRRLGRRRDDQCRRGERAPQRALQVHVRESRRPIRGVRPVGLRRFARRADGMVAIERQELDPPLPHSVGHRAAAGPRFIRGSVGRHDGLLELNQGLTHHAHSLFAASNLQDFDRNAWARPLQLVRTILTFRWIVGNRQPMSTVTKPENFGYYDEIVRVLDGLSARCARPQDTPRKNYRHGAGRSRATPESGSAPSPARLDHSEDSPLRTEDYRADCRLLSRPRCRG